VTWDWLTGHPALLFTFIATVIGVPSALAFNWQLVRSGVRWVARVRFERRMKRDLDEAERRSRNAMLDHLRETAREYRSLREEMASPLSSSRGFRMRPGYSSHGGAASTAAVENDISGYVESMARSAGRPSARRRAGTTYAMTGVAPDTPESLDDL
jgi:hypothetical protein